MDTFVGRNVVVEGRQLWVMDQGEQAEEVPLCSSIVLEVSEARPRCQAYSSVGTGMQTCVLADEDTTISNHSRVTTVCCF